MEREELAGLERIVDPMPKIEASIALIRTDRSAKRGKDPAKDSHLRVLRGFTNEARYDR